MSSVTVTALRAQQSFIGSTAAPDPVVYTADRMWTIWVDGKRLTGWYVAQTKVGTTVIRPYWIERPGQASDPRVPVTSLVPGRTVVHVMATSWHAGISAGDLARLVIKEA